MTFSSSTRLHSKILVLFSTSLATVMAAGIAKKSPTKVLISLIYNFNIIYFPRNYINNLFNTPTDAHIFI